jgi:hypothetical protein
MEGRPLIPGTTSRTVTPGEAIALWHLRLAMQAGNDNMPMTGRGLALGAALGVPLASTAALAACVRFLL